VKKPSIYALIAIGIVLVFVIVIGNRNFYVFDDETTKKIEKSLLESEERKVEIEKRRLEEELRDELERLKKPLLVLTFDDGFETDYSIVYPLLKERGIVGTSFINGGHVGNEQGKQRRMTWDQIKELKQSGWDIQGHTFSHPKLSELTEDEIRQEFILNNNAFKNNGLPEPKHTAYPYGDHDEGVKNIGKEYRKTLRRTNPSGDYPYNTWDNIDFYNVTALLSDINNFDLDRKDRLKKYIDQAIVNDGILVFYSHEFKDNDVSEYETKTDYYLEVVDYAIEKGIEFVTISEMYDLVKEYQNLLQ